jgi:hypothetical protein
MADLSYVDTNGDSVMSPGDALVVINELIRQALLRGSAGGEGEFVPDKSLESKAAVELLQSAGLTATSNPSHSATKSIRPDWHAQPQIVPPQKSAPAVDYWYGSDELDELLPGELPKSHYCFPAP